MTEFESIGDNKYRIQYPNGDVYEGEMKESSKNGQGIMTYANGDTYDGNWVNGKKEGQGRLTSYSGRRVYTGSWSNDKKNGEGTMTSRDLENDGVDVTYKGKWINDNLPTGEMDYTIISDGSKSDTYKGGLRQRYHETIDGLTIFVPHGQGGYYIDGTKYYDGNFNRGIQIETEERTTHYPDGSKITSFKSEEPIKPHPPYSSRQKKVRTVRREGTYGMTDEMMKELDKVYDMGKGGSKSKTKRREINNKKCKSKYKKIKKGCSFKKNTNKKRRKSHRK